MEIKLTPQMSPVLKTGLLGIYMAIDRWEHRDKCVLEARRVVLPDKLIPQLILDTFGFEEYRSGDTPLGFVRVSTHDPLRIKENTKMMTAAFLVHRTAGRVSVTKAGIPPISVEDGEEEQGKEKTLKFLVKQDYAHRKLAEEWGSPAKRLSLCPILGDRHTARRETSPLDRWGPEERLCAYFFAAGVKAAFLFGGRVALIMYDFSNLRKAAEAVGYAGIGDGKAVGSPERAILETVAWEASENDWFIEAAVVAPKKAPEVEQTVVAKLAKDWRDIYDAAMDDDAAAGRAVWSDITAIQLVHDELWFMGVTTWFTKRLYYLKKKGLSAGVLRLPRPRHLEEKMKPEHRAFYEVCRQAWKATLAAESERRGTKKLTRNQIVTLKDYVLSTIRGGSTPELLAHALFNQWWGRYKINVAGNISTIWDVINETNGVVAQSLALAAVLTYDPKEENR